MWLDRTLKFNPDSNKEGHVGDLWMVHGGGFYKVEKLLMGPTKVPDHLHWFKWESYWTWMSGASLVALIFYTGDGTFLLDSAVSNISYWQGVGIGLFSIIGSWFFYDFVWENRKIKDVPLIGHGLTILWLVIMSYFLCHTLSGRAAYIHIGGMLGTWMIANVFMRIIPRQLKMVEASRKNEAVNPDWGKNAKNRSTHNTYFTLPVIFIMISNHFPATYGHDFNWIILLLVCAAGAAIREYFVVRIDNPKRSKRFLVLGIVLLLATIKFSQGERSVKVTHEAPAVKKAEIIEVKPEANQAIVQTQNQPAAVGTASVTGNINFEGVPPKGKKLNLPSGCASQGDVFSNEVIVKNGKLQNALVRITKGLEAKNFSDVPNKVAELDQRGCQYKPRLLAVRVGQKVDFINSDPVFHNIRSITQNNKSFNIPMPKKDQRITMVFDKPEIFMQSKCSVHPWMGAYIAVIDHPYFSVSNEKGEFNINNLPAGNYTIEVWHEVFGSQIKEISITAGAKINLDFSFKAKP